MATTLQFRRGNTATAAAVTGLVGELYIDTDKKTIRVHDGSTAGGTILATLGDTTYIGSTAVTLNRASANLALTGISSVTLPGSSSGTAQIIPTAAAGSGTVITLPATSGTVALLANTTYVGTTSIALNRSSASQSLTGITSIDGSAATLTTTRTLWGQNFNGGANVTGDIASAGLISQAAAAPTIASAATIAPTTRIVFVSGTTAIDTITPPTSFTAGGGQIVIIPTGLFTTTTSGNIALATTAVIDRAIQMTYDATTTKWYPSY